MRRPRRRANRVTYIVNPANTVSATATNYPATWLPQPVLVNFRVSWPAAQTNVISQVETVATFLQQ